MTAQRLRSRVLCDRFCQARPIVFAELEWRIVTSSDNVETYTTGEVDKLTKQWPVVFHTAQWTVAYA